MGGGPSGGGGTTQTTNQEMPWASYVPAATSTAYNALIPQLAGQEAAGAGTGEGFTPYQQATYGGQALADVANQYGGAGQTLNASLARSGVQPGSGAGTEAIANLLRGQAGAGSAALGKVQEMNVNQQQQNLANLMKGISLPGSPVQVGGTTTYNPAGGGGSS